MEQAATQTGAAPQTPAAPAAGSPPPSISDRLKAHQSQSDAPSQEPSPDTDPEGKASPVDPNAKAEPAATTAVDDPPADGQETEQRARPTTLAELAETLGLDVEDIMAIDFPTKVDGKDGTVRARDLLKSYQLESHLNQKSMAFADEKKAFELQTQRQLGEYQQKTQQMDAALQVAQRMLDGEFANVKWDELQASDPLEFNQKVVNYQQRQQALKYVADQIGQQRQAEAQHQAQNLATYKADQMKLMQAKIPEWNDTAKRTKDIEEMSSVLNEAYGVTPDELKNVLDHREILIARDAWKWQQLQKAKPDTLKKVQAAPKLLKPGSPQSRAAQDSLASTQARERLRSTGKVSDAANALKRLGFA